MIASFFATWQVHKKKNEVFHFSIIEKKALLLMNLPFGKKIIQETQIWWCD